MHLQETTHGFAQAAEAAQFLKARLGHPPEAAIILGTGLGSVIENFKIETAFNYSEIPHFPQSTVMSHQGRLLAGTWVGRPTMVLQGRCHLYEGYAAATVTFPIRLLQALGVKTLIITNAAGGLNPAFKAGDIMAINDHINLTGDNPLVGPNEGHWGERFPVMSRAYSPDLVTLAEKAGARAGIALQKGVYVGLKGPSLETAAEMRFLRAIGADAVGFSTVVETIAAVHAGMQVLGLSTITNMCLPDNLTDTSVEDIIATAQAAAPRLTALISGVIKS